MNYPFSQSKVVYKVTFTTNYKSIELFEKFFPEEVLGISTYEVESSTIDSQDEDLWNMEILFSYKPVLVDLVQDIYSYADTNNLTIVSEPTLEVVEDKDWVKEYQQQLKPIEIGNFFITSSLIGSNCPVGKTPIFIEASRAFGTGDHATTSLCIEAMSAMANKKITSIFDIGTGSGILSFVAEKIWPQSKILACDIEEVSVEIAKNNLVCNNSNVVFYQNTESSLSIPTGWDQPFDLIVSNILAEPLISLASTMRSLTDSGSRIILSGFLDYQSESVAKAYLNAGFEIEDSLQKNRWVTLVFKVNAG
ncbi:MAG: 50S ribosomal protein L11 methyltransferase [Rickettsiaceae bacterium]